MLADLRDFTRTRLGGLLTVRRERFDVAELVREVAGELGPVHPHRRVTLECHGNLALAADRKRIGQLLSNLVGNALQHGAPDGEVQLRCTGDDHAVSVEVHNAGRAIPPEEMKRLFHPLTRQDRTGDNNHLGLGLYIAQQIAVAHGGTIDVRSSDEDGTRFTLRLPREPGAGRAVSAAAAPS